MDHKIMESKIVGWEIIIWTILGSLGRVMDYTIQYGNSPIRDRNSMTNQLDEFNMMGVDYTVHPIVR